VQFDITYGWDEGYLDSLIVDESGVCTLQGWARESSDKSDVINGLSLQMNGRFLEVLNIYRTLRPDVAAALKIPEQWLGFELQYSFAGKDVLSENTLSVLMKEKEFFSEQCQINFLSPAYPQLLDTERVLHREHIYGFGPPVDNVCPSLAALTDKLEGNVLDFGCGNGAFIHYMRQQKIEAYGIEINRPGIVDNLHLDMKEYITLYDGVLPLPYGDNEFTSTIATEVIEHIPEYEPVIAEIARVTRKRLIVTVPDMSAIPICFKNNVVPWHLLESTHVNFFTQNSLYSLLSRYFNTVTFARMGNNHTNNTLWYTSIIAICDDKKC